MLLTTVIKIVVLLSGLGNLTLATYVYLKDKNSRINKTFFYFGITTFLWCMVNVVFLFYRDIFWLRMTYSVGSVFTLFGMLFTYPLSNEKINKWFRFVLFLFCGAFFFVILFTPLVLTSISSYTQIGFTIDYGPLFYAWAAYFVSMTIMAIYVPFHALKKVDPQRRNQIFYYLTGQALLIFWTLLVVLILPAFGIGDFINLDTPATVFLIVFTSYSIVKYNLMDIKSLLFKAFTYSLAVIAIIIVLLLLMFAGSYLFANNLIWPIYVIAAVTAIVLFYIGRLFFDERRDLEQSKISLVKLLDLSEKNRVAAETERDKTGTIIRSFTDGLIILDEKNKIFSVNPKAEKILELQPKDLFEKPIGILKNYLKAVPIATILDMGLTDISKKEVILSKDFIIELSVIPLNLNDKDIGHLIVLHDVSSEKLVDKMRTEFVSLVAHQLRTPLTAVNWSMGMLKNGEFGKLSKKQGDVIETTLHNNDRLISLVNNILNITRIEGGKYLYETIMTNMDEIVSLVLDSYKPEIAKRKIKIEFKNPANLPETMIDVEKMKIVVQNLIDNAIKYSKEGGKVIITLENDTKNILFKIQDFGIGIPKTQQSKIFTKFFRSDNAAKVDPEGTGLGLFLTENIISAHGGKIWFESAEGEGTSVRFSLPIVKNRLTA